MRCMIPISPWAGNASPRTAGHRPPRPRWGRRPLACIPNERSPGACRPDCPARYAVASFTQQPSRYPLNRLLSCLAWAGFVAVAPLAACTPNYTFVTPAFSSCPAGAVGPSRLRVASYNLKSGLETNLDQVADAIGEISPDVIGLQEVDHFVHRTGNVDQAKVLADRFGYQEIFAGAIDRGGGAYGIALLTRLPIESASRIDLQATGTYEPRVAIDARVCVGPQALRVVTTHADVIAATANVATLASRIAGGVGRGLIFMGDLNEGPTGGGPKSMVRTGMVDVIGLKAEGITFWPNKSRIDYLFVDPPLREHVVSAAIDQNKASDHYPVYADFDFSSGWTAQQM